MADLGLGGVIHKPKRMERWLSVRSVAVELSNDCSPPCSASDSETKYDGQSIQDLDASGHLSAVFAVGELCDLVTYEDLEEYPREETSVCE